MQKKLKSIFFVVLSIVFSIVLACFWYFEVHSAILSSVYERIVNYPEDVYEKYEQEIERMIACKEYISEYPMQATASIENGRITLSIEIGDYESGNDWADYVTATIKNYGTDEQEVTTERNRKSVEEEHKRAEHYLKQMRVMWRIFLAIFVYLAFCLIKNSIKGRYKNVLYTMLFIIALVVVCKLFLF